MCCMEFTCILGLALSGAHSASSSACNAREAVACILLSPMDQLGSVDDLVAVCPIPVSYGRVVVAPARKVHTPLPSS